MNALVRISLKSHDKEAKIFSINLNLLKTGTEVTL